MDIILLPVLKRATRPPQALAVMKESRRSAAVMVDSPPQGLLTSIEVRKAMNQERVTLADAALEPLVVLFDGDFIANGYAELRLPESSLPTVRQHLLQTFPGMPHRQVNVPVKDLAAFENILPPHAAEAFIGFDRGAAVVITRHETRAAQSGGPPPDCCCKNPSLPHEYPAGRKRTGQVCDNCTFVVEC